MFLITAQFRPSRSKRNAEKDGVVFYRITGEVDDNGKRPARNVNSDIHAADSSVLKTERAAILSQLRLLYCVIERREDSGQPFTIDEVTDDFRKALAGDESMSAAIAKSRTEFPLRNEIVSVGREFKGDFNYVLAEQRDTIPGNIYNYIFTQSQSLKHEKRISQARNFLSLLANLKLFAEGKELYFQDVDKEYVRHYADWLKQTGITDSTQSFYLRSFRAILNKAHDDGLIESTSGWFHEVNTSVINPAKTSDGKLNRDLILQIESLDLADNRNAALVRDMFMFGFYCGGMELIDIANLEYANVRNGLLTYNRRLKGLERKVVVGKQAKKIIKRYHGNSDKYLFPLLTLSENALFSTTRNYVGQSLKIIGKAVNYPRLSFNMNITAYHSMLSKVNISELLLNKE